MMSENLENNEDIVCCLKCKKSFNKIVAFSGHYTQVHVLTKEQKSERIRKRNLTFWSKKENREKQSVTLSKIMIEKYKDVEYRNKMIKVTRENRRKDWANPEFRKMRSIVSSKSAKKLWSNEEYKQKMLLLLSNSIKENWKNINYIEKMKKVGGDVFANLWKNKNYREKMTKVMSERSKKLWENLEYRKKMKLVGSVTVSKMNYLLKNDENIRNKAILARMKAYAIKPNKCEQSLEQILNDLYPSEWKFVGDGEVVIGGFCPDFINCNGKKLIVEFDGDYWHSSEKVKEKDQRKLAKYKELGFNTLVIKENEFKSDKEGVKNRIVEFVKNYEKEHCSLLV